MVRIIRRALRVFYVGGSISFIASIVACNNMPILHPATGPGTDYPCGIQGLPCGGHMCCWQGDVCGGQPLSGCPANYCCFVGDDSDGVGAKPNRKMVTEEEMISLNK